MSRFRAVLSWRSVFVKLFKKKKVNKKETRKRAINSRCNSLTNQEIEKGA